MLFFYFIFFQILLHVAKAQDVLTSYSQNNFNDRGDTSISASSTFTYTLGNGYRCELTGFDATRTYARGFVKSTGGTATATVSGLVANAQYSYLVYVQPLTGLV
jgi:hypothetical protein